MSILSPSIRRFLTDERAAVSVEAAIMMPVLVIFSVAAYTYFDAYRRSAAMTKASYAISDILSRQTGSDTVTPAFIDGLQDIVEFVTGTEDQNFIRVTQLRKVNDRVLVQWSYATNGVDELTQDTLQAHLHRIPAMRPNEHLLALEVAAVHPPAFNMGLPVRQTHSMVVTPQRDGTPFEWDPTVVANNIQNVIFDGSSDGCLSDGNANGLQTGNANGVGTGNGQGCGHGLTGLQGTGAQTPGPGGTANNTP